MLIPTGFWSYTTSDDTNSRGKLSQLRALLAAELQQQVGRTPNVNIFQDVAAIPPGAEWERQIRAAIVEASFLIPIVTPGFLQSEWCCREVALFREREEQLGVRTLVFPIHYVDSEHIDIADNQQCHDSGVLAFLRTRQWTDFRHLRFRSHESEDVSILLETIARGILTTLREAGLVRQRAEEQRRRREAEADKAAELQRRQEADRVARLAREKQEQEEATRRAEAERQREAVEAEETRRRAEAAAEARQCQAQAEAAEQRQREEAERQARLARKNQEREEEAQRIEAARLQAQVSAEERRREAQARASAFAERTRIAEEARVRRRKDPVSHGVWRTGFIVIPAMLLLVGLAVLSGRGETPPPSEIEPSRSASEEKPRSLPEASRRSEPEDPPRPSSEAPSLPVAEEPTRSASETPPPPAPEASPSSGSEEPHRSAPAEVSYFAAELKDLEITAAAGDANAMKRLGDMFYYNGAGAEQDYIKARDWYEKAAAAGNAKAMNMLGEIYSDGRGVETDYMKAREYYEEAAKAGNTAAMNSLADLLEKGFGGLKNEERARKLRTKAAESPDE